MLRPTPTQKSMWSSSIEWRTRIYYVRECRKGKRLENDKDNDDYDDDGKYFSHDTCTQLQCQCGQFYDTIIICQGYWYSSLFPSLCLCKSWYQFYNVLFYNLLQERREKKNAICNILRRNWGICGASFFFSLSLINRLLSRQRALFLLPHSSFTIKHFQATITQNL